MRIRFMGTENLNCLSPFTIDLDILDQDPLVWMRTPIKEAYNPHASLKQVFADGWKKDDIGLVGIPRPCSDFPSTVNSAEENQVTEQAVNTLSPPRSTEKVKDADAWRKAFEDSEVVIDTGLKQPASQTSGVCGLPSHIVEAQKMQEKNILLRAKEKARQEVNHVDIERVVEIGRIRERKAGSYINRNDDKMQTWIRVV
ncbi:MAG: hypothetical protein ASARMPRED_006192 [Alectoria sarmentosa]|nr:MAG: hypothetical protein ASARMPRED_006192 [Alectoria sarmentosa]